MSEKGRRHNNRRGKLRRSRDIWKTLTIGERWRDVHSREKCSERSGCLSCGAETPFPTCLPCNKLLHPSGLGEAGVGREKTASAFPSFVSG